MNKFESGFNYKDLQGKVRILTPKGTYTTDYQQAHTTAEQQESIIWFARELGVEKDEDDIRTKCTEGERHGITTVLKLFTQYECVDDKTELLTTKGWKNVSEVTTEDKIAQWNSESGEISFTNPTRMFSKNYSGEMVRFSDTWGHVNQLVTPNHRVPVKSEATGVVAFKEASEVKLHQFNSLPVSGEVRDNGGRLTYLERFLIASQADGSYKRVKTQARELGGYRVTFGFSKERKKERLEWILSKLGWDYTKKHSKGGMTSYRVVVPFNLLESDESFKDMSSWVDLGAVDFSWCNDFLEEIAYRNTSKKNVDVVQSILPLAGRFASIRKQVDSRSNKFNDVFILSYARNSFKNGQHVKKTSEFYEGKVYCPTVETGAFVFRREGVVGITGNCMLGGEEFWGGKVNKMFPRPEIARMAATFSYIELGVHAVFYDLINKTLSIATDEFYDSWKEDPILVDRMDFISQFADEDCPLLSTAAFAFMEGAVLFSNFAFLKSLNTGGYNMIPHITAGIDASAKD